MMDQVRRRKEAFTARLNARIEMRGQCLLYRGSLAEGYPCINFRFKGQHIKMKAHRVFAILKHGAPLPLNYDVGHLPECPNRACVKHIELEHRYSNSYTDPQGNNLARAGRSPASR